jgi:hypothetical protein
MVILTTQNIRIFTLKNIPFNIVDNKREKFIRIFTRGMLKTTCETIIKNTPVIQRNMCYYSYRPNYANIAKDKKDPNLSAEKKEMIEKVEFLDKSSKSHPFIGREEENFSSSFLKIMILFL